MENGKSSKVVAIVALCVGVVGLSLGFAAFSNTLTISSSATVTPVADTFKIYFSSAQAETAAGAITATTDPEGLVTGSASINNVGTEENSYMPSITGLNVQFTEPGQKATYRFYVRNDGEYNAFLNAVTFANVAGSEAPRVCSATTLTPQEIEAGKTIATDALVQKACDDISVKVTVHETAYTGSVASIDGKTLAKKGGDTIEGVSVNDYSEVVVEIDYAANGDRADGKFSVAFGDITLTYGSVDVITSN